MAGLVRWTLSDPSNSSSYEFAVNPNDGGSPQRRRILVKQPTTAPTGKSLIFQGAKEPAVFEFSGVIQDEAHLNALVTWYEKRHQVQLTDDLGRQFWIYITGLKADRKRSAVQQWKHTYTIQAIELDWE